MKKIFLTLVGLMVFAGLVAVLEYPRLTVSESNSSLLLSQAGPADQTPASAAPRGFSYESGPFTVQYNGQNFVIGSDTLKSWQGLTKYQPVSSISWQMEPALDSTKRFLGFDVTAKPVEPVTFHYRLDKIYAYVQTLADGIDQAAIEPELTVNASSSRAVDFTPPQDGRATDVYQSSLAIASALEQNQTSADLVVSQTRPEKNLADTNNLGITELVAEGTSSFKGSPNNRRHNIAAGVEKMKGVLVAPGATFSFNDNLGPVDGQHGFLPELVIKADNTIPEFGGGLCQVSTTAFRAAMNAGVPITERRNHAYAVTYYSPQGTDATIYPGVVDLKFTNDTPGYLLIWPYEKDSNTLVFDFYGTKDSRQVTLDTPVVYDRKTDGSMKATWTREVTNNGQTRTDVFKSNYASPALYHKSEETTSSTPPAGFYVGQPG